MGLLAWLVEGALCGLAVRHFVPGRRPARRRSEIAVGCLGAVVGGAAATVLGFGGLAETDPRSLSVAALTACLGLLVERLRLYRHPGAG